MRASSANQSILLIFSCVGVLGMDSEAFAAAYANTAGSIFAEGHFSKGLASYNSGQFYNAAVQFLNCVRTNPGDARAHYYLANSYVELDRMADAIREYQAVIRLCPNSLLANYSAQAIASFPENYTKQKVNPLPPSAVKFALPEGVREIRADAGNIDIQAADEESASSAFHRNANSQIDQREDALKVEADAKVKQVLDQAAKSTEPLIQAKALLGPKSQSPKAAEYQSSIDWINSEAQKRADAITNEKNQTIQALEDSNLNPEVSLRNQQVTQHSVARRTGRYSLLSE